MFPTSVGGAMMQVAEKHHIDSPSYMVHHTGAVPFPQRKRRRRSRDANSHLPLQSFSEPRRSHLLLGFPLSGCSLITRHDASEVRWLIVKNMRSACVIYEFDVFFFASENLPDRTTSGRSERWMRWMQMSVYFVL